MKLEIILVWRTTVVKSPVGSMASPAMSCGLDL